MYRATAALVIAFVLSLVLGCNKNTTIVPKYQSQTAVMPAVAGAAGHSLVVVSFDASAVSKKLGDKRSGILLGLGSTKGGEIRLGGDLGQTFAEGFAFQLKSAGFTITGAATEAAAMDLAKAGECTGIVTGTVSNFRLNMKDKGITGTDFAGGASITVCVKAPEGKLLYQDTAEYKADYSKFVMKKGDPSGLANRILTDIVDTFCKKPEFAVALHRAAVD